MAEKPNPPPGGLRNIPQLPGCGVDSGRIFASSSFGSDGATNAGNSEDPDTREPARVAVKHSNATRRTITFLATLLALATLGAKGPAFAPSPFSPSTPALAATAGAIVYVKTFTITFHATGDEAPSAQMPKTLCNTGDAATAVFSRFSGSAEYPDLNKAPWHYGVYGDSDPVIDSTSGLLRGNKAGEVRLPRAAALKPSTMRYQVRVQCIKNKM